MKAPTGTKLIQYSEDGPTYPPALFKDGHHPKTGEVWREVGFDRCVVIGVITWHHAIRRIKGRALRMPTDFVSIQGVAGGRITRARLQRFNGKAGGYEYVRAHA